LEEFLAIIVNELDVSVPYLYDFCGRPWWRD